MSVIAVATSKGGASKTTLCACLLDYWRRAGLSTCALDTDPNRNLLAWATAADKTLACEAIAEDDVVDAITESEGKHDVVLVDVAGTLAKALVYAVGCAHAVVIPARPDMKDLVEAARTQQHVITAEKQARRLRPDMQIARAVLLTQVGRRTAVATHAREQAEAFGLPLMAAELPHRTVYQQLSFRGLPCDDPAVRGDIAAIADELGRMLGWEA